VLYDFLILKVNNPLIIFLFSFILVGSSFGEGYWATQYTNPAGSTLNDIYFVSSTEGYAAGNGGTILKTTNRGVSWESITSGVANDLSSITVQSSDIYVSYDTKVRKSTNNGSSWTEAEISAGIFTGITSLWFSDQNTGYAGGGQLLAPYDQIWKTSNASGAWAVSKTTNNLADFMIVLNLRGSSSANIWGAGYQGLDGYYLKGDGTTWTSASIPDAEKLRGVHPVSLLDAWVVGDFAINSTLTNAYHTTDGGTTWTSFNIGSDVINYKDVWFVNANEGWVSGDRGMIFHTTNGGTTWTQQTSHVTDTLSAMHFTDANSGWAASSSNCTILKYIVSPEITSISPTSGAPGTTVEVTVTGTGFQGTAGSTTDKPTLTLGEGTSISSLTYVNPTSLTASVYVYSNAATGARSAIVTNPDTGTGTKASAFTVSTSTPTQSAAVTTVSPKYPSGGQYWNPDQEGNVSLYFPVDSSTTATQATVIMTQIAPPYAAFTRKINIAAGDNKTAISPTSDFGNAFPNGIYSVFVIADGKKIAKGKIVVYR